MRTEYTIIIEKDEDGYYVGSVPALPGCHTQGTSIDQLLERMQEAIALVYSAIDAAPSVNTGVNI